MSHIDRTVTALAAPMLAIDSAGLLVGASTEALAHTLSARLSPADAARALRAAARTLEARAIAVEQTARIGRAA